ncbi:unnamed protein product (macronuclear) [Paramecium tetraurelia]|uniref:Uncharacterized protein n=1 Tax=Paramecium tetraurelia TaxID=5888 RepID=A0CW84_PARTE|nr:uncharacterized protein GSPATT00001253001 [Paramecium tetraurelia]CAK75051.1 unnamed protein product [Paramecium tetraurelia]|eukprot:XP_001442448.1 hypothetical protein (macronuclear) [Paramecium tetraurelia strain d4-2]
MQIRQEPDLDCESIKNALRNINQRLNNLQKIIPPEITVEKDPKIPKLNLKKIGIISEENKQIQKKVTANLGTNNQNLLEQQNKAPFKMRSQSFNHHIESTSLDINLKDFYCQNAYTTHVQIGKTQLNNDFEFQKRFQEILNKQNDNKENLKRECHQLIPPSHIAQPKVQQITQHHQSKINTTPVKILTKKSQPNPQINHIQNQHPLIHQQFYVQQPNQQYVKVIQNYESSNYPIIQYRYAQHHNSRSSSFHNLENYQVEKI